jgi:hypothetical protein
MNVWLGCATSSQAAKQLQELVRAGGPPPDGARWDPQPSEDEATTPAVPAGFVDCTLILGTAARIRLTFEAPLLPSGPWLVATPSGRELLDREGWTMAGEPANSTIDLLDEGLPSYVVIEWSTSAGSLAGTLSVNVEDVEDLPPPPQISEIPAELILAALASTRPLPTALAIEMARQGSSIANGPDPSLDPIRRFDDNSLLLQRARQYSQSLWGLERRLSRTTTSLEALRWRLAGVLGPQQLAQKIVAAFRDERMSCSEARFALAELALTVRSVNWALVTQSLDQGKVRRQVEEIISSIAEQAAELPPSSDPLLNDYVSDAMKKAASAWL